MIMTVLAWIAWAIGFKKCVHKWGKWSVVEINSDGKGHQHRICTKCRLFKVRFVN